MGVILMFDQYLLNYISVEAEAKPRDCLQLKSSGFRSSGVYTIYIDDSPVDVYCDMETECGGWTVGR